MRRDSQALQDREHDVLVIGGGIAGAWVAWEAASRGLKAALVELADFGQATSWSSLKTAHGGLRHLQRLDVAGFRESVQERRTLLRVAPEIVRPLPFAVAATSLPDQIKFFLGGLANDVLSLDRNEGVRDDRTLGPSRLTRSAGDPATRAAFPEGSVFVWQDAQITHTERLLLSLLHAAADASAVIMNHCRINSSTRTSGGFEIRASDLEDGTELKIRARSIVNAAGAEIERVSRQFGETCSSPPLIRGVNVVLGRDLTPSMAVGARDRGAFLFLVPWMGRSILGTIYDDGQGPVDRQVHELIEAGGRAFPWSEIRADDVRVVHSGHVPRAPNGEPIYRSRVISHSDTRMVSILTAKYTTARAAAEAAVNRVGAALAITLPPSVSAHTALSMAKPLTGTPFERLRLVQKTEMALSPKDAVRGRLIEGALGEEVDSRALGA